MTAFFEKSLESQSKGVAAGIPSGPPPLPEKITAEEKKTLAAAMEPLLAKYLPKMGPYMVEVNAAIALIAVFGPRVMAARERRIWLDASFQQQRLAPVAATPNGAALAPSLEEGVAAQQQPGGRLTDVGDSFLARLKERQP
jgi:hypothetical protein